MFYSFAPTGGVLLISRKQRMLFSEAPIILLFFSTEGEALISRKQRVLFQIPHVLQFCPHRGGASDFQKAKGAFSEPPIVILFFLTEGGP